MKFKHIIFSLLSAFLALSFGLHTFYVSITDFDYNEDSKEYQVTSQLFLDDLELELGEELSDDILSEYFSTHFIVYRNDHKIDLEFLGYEIEEESVFVFQYFKSKAKGKYFIENRLLFDKFKEQKNNLNFNSIEFKTSKVFTLDNPKQEFIVP